MALRNARRMLLLVNALLDFSRLEAGRAKASFQPVNLTAVTRDLASVFRAACEQAGLALRVESDGSDPTVYVDIEMWEKVRVALRIMRDQYCLSVCFRLCSICSRMPTTSRLEAASPSRWRPMPRTSS